jgi:iron(III) transport system permease protein
MIGNLLTRAIFALAIVACVVTLAVIVVPLAIVVVTGFLSAPIGRGSFSLEQYAFVLGDVHALPQLATTLIFALGSSAISVGVATLFAWAIAFVDLPFKKVLRLMPLAVMILPPLLKDPAWIELYSPKIGLINLAAMKLFGLSAGPFNIYTLTGMIILVGCNIVPIAYVILLAPFENLDQSFEEASRMSGARPWRTMLRVVVPILVPAFLSAIALTMIQVASSFETPVLVGLPGGIITYMSAIYASVTGTVEPNINRAAAQSTVYLILTGALLAWYLIATRKERRFVSITSQVKTRRSSVSPLVRQLVVAAFVFYFILTFILPVAITVLVALLPYYSVSSGNPLRPGFSFVNFETLMHTSRVTSAFVTSLWLSGVTAILALVAAAGLSYIALKTRLPGRRAAELLGTLPISVPSMVFGLALLVTFVSMPGARLFYNTYAPMILAEVVIFLPFAVRVMSSALIQVDNSLLEAGVMSGSGRSKVLRDILLPILSPAVINALALVFVLSFRELGAVVLLVAANTVLVPTVTFDYWIAADLGAVAALNLLAFFVPAIAMGVVWGLLRGGLWLMMRRQTLVLPNLESAHA